MDAELDLFANGTDDAPETEPVTADQTAATSAAEEGDDGLECDYGGRRKAKCRRTAAEAQADKVAKAEARAGKAAAKLEALKNNGGAGKNGGAAKAKKTARV